MYVYIYTLVFHFYLSKVFEYFCNFWKWVKKKIYVSSVAWWYRIDFRIDWHSRLKYRYRIQSDNPVSGQPYFRATWILSEALVVLQWFLFEGIRTQTDPPPRKQRVDCTCQTRSSSTEICTTSSRKTLSAHDYLPTYFGAADSLPQRRPLERKHWWRQKPARQRNLVFRRNWLWVFSLQLRGFLRKTREREKQQTGCSTFD